MSTATWDIVVEHDHDVDDVDHEGVTRHDATGTDDAMEHI